MVEGAPGKCYCVRCDFFWELDHFLPTSWHKDGNDGERFLSSLAMWNKLTESEKGNRYRPANAPNILQEPAEVARAAREASRSPFHLWLEKQRGRNDLIGDLAQDILSDKGFPLGASTRREVEDYLSHHGEHINNAVRDAWFEYEAPPKKTLAQALAQELGISAFEAEELADAEVQERTGHGDEMVYSYFFDFTDYASPALAAKLRKKLGSLQFEIPLWFFDDIHDFADIR
ncbi:YozE family protein [Chitinibacter sp. S2-10]|uniref:YozE family protein n=1 Tax=Chitinibacter sp. S2-10 TaxID=3373597 RepID=UPI0039778534